MQKTKLIERLVNTIFSSNAKKVLNELVRAEFDKTKDEERAFVLLQIAYSHQLDCLNSMLDDYEFADFKWFFN